MFQYIDLLHYLLMKTSTALFFIGLQQPVNLLTDCINELLILPSAAVVPGDLDNFFYQSFIRLSAVRELIPGFLVLRKVTTNCLTVDSQLPCYPSLRISVPVPEQNNLLLHTHFDHFLFFSHLSKYMTKIYNIG